MNFLLDPKLRQLLITVLDSHNYEDLCVALEELPAIIPGTIYTSTPTKPKHTHIKPEIDRRHA